MNCKGCDKDLEGVEHKMVAQWAFCLECFDNLMNKAERDKKAAAVAVAKSAARAAEPEPAKGKVCSMCERELAEGEGHNMLVWTFCPECYQSVATRPKSLAPEEPEEPEVEEDHTPMQRLTYVLCAGCGRRIPEKGSRDVDGDPHCPECYQIAIKDLPPPGVKRQLRKLTPKEDPAPPKKEREAPRISFAVSAGPEEEPEEEPEG